MFSVPGWGGGSERDEYLPLLPQDLDNRKQVSFSDLERNVVPWMGYTGSCTVVTPYYPTYQFTLKTLQFIYGKVEVLPDASERILPERLQEIWKDSEICKVDNLLLKGKGPLQIVV